MIQADAALKILKLHEQDYDNYVSKLKSKSKAADQAASNAQSTADKASQSVTDAQGNKAGRLSQKAKDLLAKNGGLSGVGDTIQNVMKYVRGSNQPSDYAVSVGNAAGSATLDPAAIPAKTILGMPPMVVYVGGGILLLGVLYGLSRMAGKKDALEDDALLPTPKPLPNAHPNPIQ